MDSRSLADIPEEEIYHNSESTSGSEAEEEKSNASSTQLADEILKNFPSTIQSEPHSKNIYQIERENLKKVHQSLLHRRQHHLQTTTISFPINQNSSPQSFSLHAPSRDSLTSRTPEKSDMKWQEIELISLASENSCLLDIQCSDPPKSKT